MPRGVPNKPVVSTAVEEAIIHTPEVLSRIEFHLEDIASKLPDDSRELATELAENTSAMHKFREELAGILRGPQRAGTFSEGIAHAAKLYDETIDA